MAVSSYPSLATVDHSTAMELESLRKAFENLKFENKQLKIKYEETRDRVHVLENENRRLQVPHLIIHYKRFIAIY